MNIYVDNKLLRELLKQKSSSLWNDFMESSFQQGFLSKEAPFSLIFRWPNLFDYLELNGVFENFFQLDDSNPLFSYLLSTLASGSQNEKLYDVFDQLFVECLTHVKALPQINASFLVEEIRKRNPHAMFSDTLNRYAHDLIENRAERMHDLILYLAWDRVCVNLAMLFEYPKMDTKSLNGLKVLRECLIESFQHITTHNKTKPSFFRFLEALYAFEMRQENLDTHTDEEWKILCEASRILKSRDKILDEPFIDLSLIKNLDQAFKPILNDKMIFTLEDEKVAKSAKSFAECMIDKLIREPCDWMFKINTLPIVYAK